MEENTGGTAFVKKYQQRRTLQKNVMVLMVILIFALVISSAIYSYNWIIPLFILALAYQGFMLVNYRCPICGAIQWRTNQRKEWDPHSCSRCGTRLEIEG
jgi:hypothetical protein